MYDMFCCSLLDVCANPTNEGMTYSHFGNCKQYWHCEGGTSVPRCCIGFEHYNASKGDCDYNRDKPCSPHECDATLIPGNNSA